jgi:prepilin peptidase CpaA
MSLLALLQTGCLIAFAGLLLVAAWRDLRTMRIANGFSLAIVGAFGVWAVAGLAGGALSLQALAWAIACGAGLFALGAAAFAVGMIGGGDVKLMAAVGLFAGPALLLDFLTIMALAGGALGFAVLAGAPIGSASTRGGEMTVRARLRGGLPYGPAIATGGLWVAALRIAG